MLVKRRDFVIGIAAAGAAPTAVAGARPAPSALDLDTEAGRLMAIVKMRGTLSDQVTRGFVVGRYHGIVDDQAKPLFGVLAGTISRYQQISPTQFRVRALEVAYFTDLDSGELLGDWLNPYTGETVTVPQTRMGPSTTTLSADGLVIDEAAGEARQMQLNHRFRPPTVVGDDVWIAEEISAVAGGGSFAYNEMTHYQATIADLADPEQQSVRSHVQFTSAVTWRPWMKMKGHPGHLHGAAAGRHIKSPNEWPDYYQELCREHHPDYLEEPERLLA